MSPNRKRSMREGILFTDQYQLTMAQLYFRQGLHETSVQFDHFFRNYPDYGSHQAGYCINAGLDTLLDWMEEARFRPADIEILRGQRDSAGNPLFAADFLAWLGEHGHFGELTVRAIPEGRVVHPHTTLSAIEGPLAMAQIVETALLNKLNFQTLIATKAARLVESGRGRPVLEFGLRRAQGSGANDGTRAALIGGADFSSNVGASHALGLQPKGTHAHSMVQLFMTLGQGELGAFRAFAELYPDDCLLLVDTIDTLGSGIPNAIRVFDELKRKGHRPVGIRLDSGDQAYLSIQAARMLNRAGHTETAIVLSSDLDELVIWQIITQISQEAPRYGLDADQIIQRLVYGVGTRLITSAGDSALGGVYKLVAVKQNGQWDSAIKISESAAKTPNPGYKHLWRLYDRRGRATVDLLSLESEPPALDQSITLHHPRDHTRFRHVPAGEVSAAEPLLQEAWRNGQRSREAEPIDIARARRVADVDRLHPGVRRLVNPHVYHVSLTQELWDLKHELIAEARADR